MKYMAVESATKQNRTSQMTEENVIVFRFHSF